MSITFRPSDQTYYKALSPFFDKTQPEHPIFNPRYDNVPCLPEVNFSNINALIILNLLVGDKAADYCGTVACHSIPDLIEKCYKLTDQNHEMSKRLKALAEVLHVCVANGKDLHWN